MRRGARIALITLAVVAAAFLAAFLAGPRVSGEFLREPLERALTAAFRTPTRIEGPLLLQTGLSATVTADALVLADPSGPVGATLARGIRPSARIDLIALLRRTVALEEVTGEKLELTLLRRADGHTNWAHIFARRGEGTASVSFAGIARLRIGSVTGSYQREGDAPLPFALTAFDGTLPLREPMAARGSVLVAGQPAVFDLRSASFTELARRGATVPLQGTVQWSGMRAELAGSLARDGSGLDAEVHASADDAGPPLAALGIAANEPGRLDLRMRLAMSATEAVARDLALTLGSSVVTGSASIAWAPPRQRVMADIAGERIDIAPFAFGRSLPPEKTAPEVFVDLLESAATGADAEVRLAIGEIAGLPVTARELRFEGRSRDRTVAVKSDALVAGTRVRVSLDYDARKPQRTLAARVDGGAASTAKLPSAARPRELSGSAAGIRGQVRAEGADARALLASAQGDLEARELRWSLERSQGPPLTGRFDLARVALQGTRATSAEVAGTLGDAACTLKVSGGALASLLDGGSWPLQLAGSCPGERFSAKGRLALAQRHVAADLAFDVAAERIGAIARAVGVGPTVPYPLAARGTLAIDEKLARAQFSALRLGRTAGSGEIAFAFGASSAPRLQLALTALDIDEVSAIAGSGAVPADPFEREVLRKTMRLPDVDFEIAAERVSLAGANLRRLLLSGAIRSRTLPPARFRFDWDGVPLSGRFGADFSGAAPRIQFEVTAGDADLRPLIARFGPADVGLRVGLLSLRARAQGARLGELLASTTLSMTIERGQFELPPHHTAGLSGRADVSAKFDAAPGQPTVLAARGTIDGQPMDLAVDASGLADLARANGSLPVTLRLAIGDARLEATGKVTRSGTGEGRLQIGGGRLDRLGRLLGMELPEVGPYAASGNVVVSAGSAQATDLAATFGRSRLAGQLQIDSRPGGRARHRAQLRMPVLHLEDIGAGHWLHDGGRSGAGEAPQASTAPREEGGIERSLRLARAADIDVTIDIEALYGAGEPFASGRLQARTDAGVLRLQLQDVRTAGGELDADIRADASVAPPKFAVRSRIRGLEFGPVLRSLDPESKMAGTLDLIADLAAQGPPGRLLPALSGTIDAAVFPRGLYSPALGLWGAGLLNALLQQLDPDGRSAVDCAVTSLDLKGGVASSTAFFVDTTRVRILGEYEVDLATRALSGRIEPLSKEPQMLAFAPTLLLGGTLDSPRVSSAPENIVTVPLRFAASLTPFALDWRAVRGPAREGVAACREAFERIRQGR